MATPAPSNVPEAETPKLKIYFLPNLLTAGNLTCGFVALTKIVEADLSTGDFKQIKIALAYILLACIFDLFDGRVARMGGRESPFGREFDSLADLISFGAAPAFLVHRIVLKDVFVNYPQIGWFIASIYLICGAFRLARFNCLAAMSGSGGGKEFLGFPIPSAAGMVASLTYFMIWWNEKAFAQGSWKYVLPVLMIFLSCMMVSEVKYPTFKSLDLKATRTFTKTLVTIIFIVAVLILQEHILTWALPILFTSYLIYGFIRPHISRKMRQEIEEEEEGDDAAPTV
ncbi:CDP-diacylglycerol--serine O-phosphatidyltransferase [Pedosphaera parvula]|uniref:CDP-diacylglycerol--serine O-phosphatidyltransferase n=1 Tax=Pedosphaera parvula (strain Ellin514) TaxID=320771 RepID=B9XRG0_PEDPL|nr:CDP-diacylglycerol--serine O-phosphatidyltransferase [Pedosphaera parvula]EEF57594.1 CDP-diacylglycerol/serine O-phosphatidyltransferase [Pedosphaera parvula Ellin514]